MSLRRQQVDLTRRSIVEAFFDLSNGADTPVTVAEVARASGISPATIYRHFPNREALVFAAANAHVGAGVDERQSTWDLDDLRRHLVAIWTSMATNMPLARAATVSEAGRELRAARFEPFRRSIEWSLRSSGVDPTGRDARRFAAAMALVTSAHAFIDCHDRQGLSVEESADVARWAAAALVAAIGLDPATFRMSDPPAEQESEEVPNR